jgi:hypothetical protein
MGYWALNDVNTLLRRSRDRAKRIFHSATGWHLLTREGVTVGPYESRCDAEDALREHFEDTLVPGLSGARGGGSGFGK